MLARHKLTGTSVAIKIITKLKEKTNVSPEQEVRSLKMLSHPHIVQLFQVVENTDKLVLVMEYQEGGDLLGYLQQHGCLSEREVHDKFCQILLALQHCHAKGTVHRDLKPDNLLLDHQGKFKLADFWLSMEFFDDLLNAYYGTPEYAAPEIHLHRPYNCPGVDIWSLGVVLYRMVTGSLPFLGKNACEVGERIVSGNFHMPDYLSTQCQELLSRMMVLDPKKRANIDTIIDHPWVKMRKGLLSLRVPSHDHVDPAIMEAMMSFGFQRNQVHRAVAEQRYDSIMGTFLILCSTKLEAEEEAQRHAIFGEYSHPSGSDCAGPSKRYTLQHGLSRKNNDPVKPCVPWTQSMIQKEQGRKPLARVISRPACKARSGPVSQLQHTREHMFPYIPVPELDVPGEHKNASMPSLRLEVPREMETSLKP
ncbi:PREDICTED: serine/threonine-protein kinase MARK2-like [Condylura cristata]|uniref:serine/threonine-protein kinase MARK2-like n=1 Tax=Condylura cristata TaxID=143302 RepID=UPI0006432A28|nr:PREDICTED: serine/threonine-protein kinase MARK2-like [Condylura cristata]